MSAIDRKAELMTEWPKGYVTALGKFEGEPISTIYFWDLMMDGRSDETLYEGDTPIEVFFVDDDDRILWDLSADTYAVAVYETSTGFVMKHEWTQNKYDDTVNICAQSGDDDDR